MSPKRKNITRTAEERIRRQEARRARIERTLRFPWKHALLGLVCAVLVMVFLGINLLSLFLVASLATVLCGSRRGSGRFPF